MRTTPLLLGALCLLAARVSAAELVPAGEPVGGRTQSDWSARWWQWAASFEQDVSPVADRNGQFCAAKQSGEVWFLAGTYGTRRTVRRCRVPAGKHLFFPLINYVVFPSDGRSLSCATATREAAAVTDEIANLVLEVDGQRFNALRSHRQATRACFDLGARTDNAVRVYPAAGNGYYVMLRPLAPGRHTLNFGGALPGMVQDVTYTLDVE